MSIDQELLVLAAKAAEIPLKQDFSERFEYYMQSPLMWNPLRDDGDALRLAVKMDLFIIIEKKNGVVYASKDGWRVGQEKEESIVPDQYAATRRAIVRAAAEIGRNMP